MAQSLFEEACYCFVYGQFLATIFSGLAYIERNLSALFYAEGRNDLERAGFSILLREAYSHGLMGLREFTELERIYRIRNDYVHFRKPGHELSVEYQSTVEGEAPYEIIERVAADVIALAFHIAGKNAI